MGKYMMEIQLFGASLQMPSLLTEMFQSVVSEEYLQQY